MHTTAVPGRTPALEPPLETISPELVLVDPELRLRALEALASPRTGHPASAAGLPIGPASGVAAVRVDEVERPAVRPARSLRRGYVLSVTVIATAAVVLAFALPTVFQPDSGSKRRTAASVPWIPEAVDREPIVTTPRTAREPAAPDVAWRTRRRTPTVASPPAKWTFVWPARASADYYNVRFFRRGKAIFEAWPRQPRLVVPERGVSHGEPFRFSPGRYRWVARPGFGPRARGHYGQSIVVSTWTVAGSEPE